jgi:hypothetical protein
MKMKRLSILASMLMALIAFTACSTNRDDNPVLSLPEDGSFVLYAPGISANTIDLDNSTSLTFKVDQPNYGYTAHITYMMEFAASEDGSTWSEWQTTETSNEDPLAITVPTSEIAGAVTSALVELGREEVDFPLTAKVKARVHAYLSGKEETTSVYSNEVILTATTSYVLPPVPSLLFYIVGAQPGWSGAEAITAVLYPEGGDVYTYTTKFTGAWDLKIWDAASFGNWDKAFGCAVDGDNSPSGALIGTGAQAISAPSAEFYTFTIDMKNMKYTWIKLDNQDPTTYEHISLIGSFNGWSDDYELKEVTPHNWYAEFTQEESGELKLRANHDWGINWGVNLEEGLWDVSAKMNNIGSNGANNIYVPAGTYDVYLNDITNSILFLAK